MINDQGGINGRKINFITRDDAYSSRNTVEQIRQLVEQDGVLLTFNTLGTLARWPSNLPFVFWNLLTPQPASINTSLSLVFTRIVLICSSTALDGCVYTSPNLTRVRAAALAGLANTPLPASAVIAGLRILDAEAGLPRLPNLEFAIYEKARPDKAAAALAAALLALAQGPSRPTI